MPIPTHSAIAIRGIYDIRTLFTKEAELQKLDLLKRIKLTEIRSTRTMQLYYDVLLFLIAYPGSRTIYNIALQALSELELFITSNDRIREQLFNSGVGGSSVCAAFGFEVTKWLRQTYGQDITLDSIEADDSVISANLSIVMSKAESEILQDCNDNWKNWLKQFKNREQDMLDALIDTFGQTDISPEVKDEIWNDLGINITISNRLTCRLPEHLFEPYFHKKLIKHTAYPPPPGTALPVQLKITTGDAEKIIECGRMILVQHLREIDPISFTKPEYVRYYKLQRGVTVALMGMSPGRRHPIDSYMGYVAFKNGVPVAYAGSWIMFDSGRIGLNIFPSYRGGESMFIFQQILHLHQQVYRLNRFTVDPYQIGKDNYDGINSGAFWIYYNMGFRPIKNEQKKIAESENVLRQTKKGYRSPASVLKKLADSRMELKMKDRSVQFDATDLSRIYMHKVKVGYGNNRSAALRNNCYTLIKILRMEYAYADETLMFVLKNWCVLIEELFPAIRANKQLQQKLRKLFELKAHKSEDQYIRLLCTIKEIRNLWANLYDMNSNT